MTKLNYKGFFKDWEIGIAKSLIEKIRCSSIYLQREGFDDLLQICLWHWHLVENKYDPSIGASRQTFMHRVVKNKLFNIIEELKSDKRKILTEALSLNQPLSDDEDAPTLIDTIPDEKDSAAELRIHCSLEVYFARILPKLNPRQQKICHLFKRGFNMTEVSKALKIPRTTLYEDKKRIKTLFKKAKP